MCNMNNGRCRLSIRLFGRPKQDKKDGKKEEMKWDVRLLPASMSQEFQSKQSSNNQSLSRRGQGYHRE